MTPLQSQFNVTLAALESANDEVSELRAELERLHELFCIDGEQHSAYVKTILHDQDTRLAAYKAEIDRLQAIEDAAIDAATYFHMGAGGEKDFDAQRMVDLMAKLGRALEHKP